MSYALVAGFDEDEPKSGQKTEVMYVNGTTEICHSTANYPVNAQFLNGDSFLKNDLIVVCGGGPLACYSMSNDLKWTNFANLTNATSDAAYVIVKNGLWMTGTSGCFQLLFEKL